MLYMFLAVWGTCWMASSCSTLRKRMDSAEQHRFAYTHTAFASDSAVRYWHFISDTAFSYHPDSGLRTLSGRLLGWERRVSLRLEEHTLDSASSYQHSAKELTRDRKSIWQLHHYISILLLMVLVVAICYRIRVNITKT